MGAARKLQSEIDRTLKKVQEGIIEFDEIWNKIYDADNQTQREKYENDLKKEIKKLQRLRDQIKTWINGNDIKDKSSLTDARKNIERKMEQFKNCEKEAKTKAFSKAGLGQAAKLDPEEKARQSTREWLNDQVEALQMQIDEFESELEGLNSSRRGKKPSERQEILEECVNRHRGHIARLEQCMRCLDNDTVNYQEIDDLKDLVEYYVNENQEDDLGYTTVDENYSTVLDRLNDVTLGVQSLTLQQKLNKTKDIDEERDKERAAAAAVKAQLASHGSSQLSTLIDEEKKLNVKTPTPTGASSKKGGMSESSSGNHSSTDETESETAMMQSKGTVRNEPQTAAGRSNVSVSMTQQKSTSLTGSLRSENEDFPKLQSSGVSEKSKSDELSEDVKTSPRQSAPSSSTQTTLPLINTTDSVPGSSKGSTDPMLTTMTLDELTSALSMQCGAPRGSAGGVVSTPSPPSQFEGNPAASLQLLRACNRGALPQQIDGDYRVQLFHNTSRVFSQQLPASYPVYRLPQLEDSNFYKQLDTEGLFYAFYFHPEDIVQYCAARELKRQSWRYHLEHKFWFKPTGDPTVKTDDYEEGACIYFDRVLTSSSALPGDSSSADMNGWCYRRKDNFMFTRDQVDDDNDVDSH
eukprot:g8049.t1